MRFIPSLWHGVLDYLTAVTLFALPWVLGLSAPVATFFWVMAGATGLYSLITRYELGVLKVMPMRAHLMLDALSGAAFLVAAFLFTHEAMGARVLMAGIGVFEALASAMTIREPYAAGSAAEVGATRPDRRRQPGM